MLRAVMQIWSIITDSVAGKLSGMKTLLTLCGFLRISAVSEPCPVKNAEKETGYVSRAYPISNLTGHRAVPRQTQR